MPGSWTTRRSRRGSTRSSRRSAPPTGSPCCSSGSTTCRCAAHDLRGNPSAALGAIVQRIDRLKDELISAADYATWAATLPEGRAREREFAELYGAHERMLDEAGTLDAGDLVLQSFRLLRTNPRVRARLAERHRHVLVDELQDASFAQGLLLRLLAGAAGGPITAAADENQAIHRFRGAATKNVQDFRAEWPTATVARLETSFRSRERILAAAGGGQTLRGEPGGDVALPRRANERAQAQGVVVIERLIREGERPECIARPRRSVRTRARQRRSCSRSVAPFRVVGPVRSSSVRRGARRARRAAACRPGRRGAVVRAPPAAHRAAVGRRRYFEIARRASSTWS